MSDWVPSYIATLEIECWSTEQIQTIITFYSDVWLSPVKYRGARNWLLKLWANSNNNNFLHGCLIESRNMSRRSIYYAAESNLRVKSNDHLNFSRACVVEFRACRWVMPPNRTSVWKLMTIRICSELQHSISSVLMYYGIQSDIK